ncbi:hypothetical protein HPP92_006255 [Vanilla planifolia]|uniref:Protein SDA1 n=1 Tax=Vanilla planifolia TaxID=51239 RepID=A0A835RN85_VANPL|nr:hypothetical protein HPP92_006255 [Vanilla planifolia]
MGKMKILTMGKIHQIERKGSLGNFVECKDAIDASPHSLKRLAIIKVIEVSTNEVDGIVSNEDFQSIKELKANKEAKKALSQHGLLRKDEGYKAATSEIPSFEQLSSKRLNPIKLEVHVRSKLSKQERVALIRAGRGDREKYEAKTVVKQKKI